MYMVCQCMEALGEVTRVVPLLSSPTMRVLPVPSTTTLIPGRSKEVVELTESWPVMRNVPPFMVSVPAAPGTELPIFKVWAVTVLLEATLIEQTPAVPRSSEPLVTFKLPPATTTELVEDRKVPTTVRLEVTLTVPLLWMVS